MSNHSPLKVLQVLPTLSAGGAEGFVTNLGVSLAALGCDVRFFLLAGVRGARGEVLLKRLSTAGIEVVGTEQRKPASARNLLRLARTIRSWRPSIVQANLRSTETACVCARPLALGSGARYVRRLANTNTYEYSFTWFDRFFDATIACSPAVADSYRAYMKDTFHGALVTIQNGGLLLDAAPTEQEKGEARNELGLPEDAFVIAHVGRMFAGGDGSVGGLQAGQKGQDVLLKAFARAFGGDATCHLVLVGEGPMQSEVKELARELGIEKRTHLLGQLPEPWPALRAADMFCFPSRHEGMPNVLPEAASCGLPVVASDIPEIRALYPGDAWLLAPVDDIEAFSGHMQSVRANIEEYRRLATVAAEGFRERFSMKTCAELYVQTYANVLAASGARS